jgi:hypothetical protein
MRRGRDILEHNLWVLVLQLTGSPEAGNLVVRGWGQSEKDGEAGAKKVDRH